MKRVKEIRTSRETRFYEKRMRPVKAMKKKDDLVTLKKGVHLIVSPATKEYSVMSQKIKERHALVKKAAAMAEEHGVKQE